MMGQSVWHKDNIGQIGQTLIDMAPSYEFAAGVAALCRAMDATVRLPEPRGVTVVMMEPGDNGRQVVMMEPGDNGRQVVMHER